MSIRRSLLVPLVPLALASCRVPDAPRPDPSVSALIPILAAEDARPAGGRALDLLVAATAEGSPLLRAAAVRALGRQERPELAVHVEPLLSDPDPEVRARAADALAQAHHRGDGTAALAPLVRRAGIEPDARVRGVLARSLGRLRLDRAGRREAARALLELTRPRGGEEPDPDQLVGGALGFESHVRGAGGEPLGGGVLARLRALASYGAPARDGDPRPARVRQVAILALAAARALSEEDVLRGMDDPDAGVRRAAAAWLSRSGVPPAPALVEHALADASAQVRVEAVRAAAATGPAGCAWLLAVAEGDPDTGVRLVALDALAGSCALGAERVGLLERTAEGLPPSADAGWHEAAHALAALAAVDGARATPLLPRFLEHASPFVRAWAAQAGTRAGAAGALRALVDDRDANVRAAALDGLASLEGPAADSLLIAALARDDAPQVVLALVPRLAGTPRAGEAVRAAATTLARLGSTGWMTLRDPRVALVELIGTLGDAASAPLLEPLLADPDPAVAAAAAAVLARWTGRRVEAAPAAPPELPFPTAAQIAAMRHEEVVLHMARGGEITIALLPLEAPTNVFRLRQMARAGTLDGLTFHRVVPNFVIQGGSPLANEYGGHGAFTRDEVGLPVQWRGTVGVSTRGRDTGDGQIYVNLVDNVRLDHDYTILGFVLSGMEAVDAVLEGDVIERAEVRRR